LERSRFISLLSHMCLILRDLFRIYFNFGIGNRDLYMRLGSLVCGLLISIVYLMDFLYLQRGRESRPCREILYIDAYNACAVLCLL
jgi:hypothetical protein